MKAQDQSSKRFRDLCNWPPLWVRLAKVSSTEAMAFAGEVGILTQVRQYEDRSEKLYLTMLQKHATYVSCLAFGNRASCDKAYEHLRRCYGMSIDALGSSELP